MLLILALLAQAPAAAGQLLYKAPAAWTVTPVTSSMRVGEFRLPKADGDSEDAALVVYYFGGTGGSVQANIDRWVGQISQPDGRASKDVAIVTNRKVNGLAMTHVDVSGTLVAEVTPGSAERFNKPGFRLRAAVIETPKGPYFIRVVGPAKTVARWEKDIEAFLSSVSFK